MDTSKVTEIQYFGLRIPIPDEHRTAVLVVLSCFVLYSLVMVAFDARRRGKNWFLAILFVLTAGWPLSLVWWQWLRPKFPSPNPVACS